MANRRRPKHPKRPAERPPQLDLFADRPRELRQVREPEAGLVPTDREPILREWRDRYRQLERELAELAAKTEEYHFQAEPAFQAWVARTFGEELSAIREIEEKIRESELIALATLEEARASDSPESEAYRVVLLRKERGEDLFPSPDDWDDGWEEVDPGRDYRAEAESDEPRRERKAPRDADAEPELDPDEASREYFRSQKKEAAAAKPDENAGRLKAAYRKLAFALHPDANPNLTVRERKIWDEVQVAYAEGDLERLEMLQAWIESGSEDWLERMTHVGTLRTLVLKKIAEVRATHGSFNRLRRAAPWKFWSARGLPEKVDAVRVDLEEEFIREFLGLQRRLREFELRFRRWAGGDRGPRTRVRRRRK